MPRTISSSDLRKMSAEDRARFVEAAFADSGEALSSYLDLLDARLRVFEQRYEMPSSDLPAAVESGELPDTAEISEWLLGGRAEAACPGNPGLTGSAPIGPK